MSYSELDERRDRESEYRHAKNRYLDDLAEKCEYYFYDEEEGIGRCTAQPDMGECLYSRCDFLNEWAEEIAIADDPGNYYR